MQVDKDALRAHFGAEALGDIKSAESWIPLLSPTSQTGVVSIPTTSVESEYGSVAQAVEGVVARVDGQASALRELLGQEGNAQEAFRTALLLRNTIKIAGNVEAYLRVVALLQRAPKHQVVGFDLHATDQTAIAAVGFARLGLHEPVMLLKYVAADTLRCLLLRNPDALQGQAIVKRINEETKSTKVFLSVQRALKSLAAIGTTLMPVDCLCEHLRCDDKLGITTLLPLDKAQLEHLFDANLNPAIAEFLMHMAFMPSCSSTAQETARGTMLWMASAAAEEIQKHESLRDELALEGIVTDPAKVEAELKRQLAEVQSRLAVSGPAVRLAYARLAAVRQQLLTAKELTPELVVTLQTKLLTLEEALQAMQDAEMATWAHLQERLGALDALQTQVATLEAQCDDAQCALETETRARMATGMRFFRTLLAMPQMRSIDGENTLADTAQDAIQDLLGKNSDAIQDELSIFSRVFETLPTNATYVVHRTQAWLLEPPLETARAKFNALIVLQRMLTGNEPPELCVDGSCVRHGINSAVGAFAALLKPMANKLGLYGAAAETFAKVRLLGAMQTLLEGVDRRSFFTTLTLRAAHRDVRAKLGVRHLKSTLYHDHENFDAEIWRVFGFLWALPESELDAILQRVARGDALQGTNEDNRRANNLKKFVETVHMLLLGKPVAAEDLQAFFAASDTATWMVRIIRHVVGHLCDDVMCTAQGDLGLFYVVTREYNHRLQPRGSEYKAVMMEDCMFEADSFLSRVVQACLAMPLPAAPTPAAPTPTPEAAPEASPELWSEASLKRMYAVQKQVAIPGPVTDDVPLVQDRVTPSLASHGKWMLLYDADDTAASDAVQFLRKAGYERAAATGGYLAGEEPAKYEDWQVREMAPDPATVGACFGAIQQGEAKPCVGELVLRIKERFQSSFQMNEDEKAAVQRRVYGRGGAAQPYVPTLIDILLVRLQTGVCYST